MDESGIKHHKPTNQQFLYKPLLNIESIVSRDKQEYFPWLYEH